MDIALVPDNVAAILSNNKRIHQGIVRIKEKNLAHILGRKPYNNGKAVASVRHGIFTGNAKQNHAIPVAVGSGGRLALSVPQAI